MTPFPPALDVDELGFRDLLAIANAILTKYPPDTIVCSHHPEADIGARTVAAIRDLVQSSGRRLSDADEVMRLRSIEGAARALLTDDGPATTDRRRWDEFVAALASRP